jgi:hypothetical protein
MVSVLRVSCAIKTVHWMNPVNLFGTGELENISLNAFWQARIRFQVVFNNEHS